MTELRRAEDKNHASNRRRDGMFVAAFILLAGLVIAVLLFPSLSEYTQGVITLVIGQVVGWIAAMYAFEFGTTRSSAVKDSTITELSKKP